MDNIVLIGMPGSGKSTLGVLIAKKLVMKFTDTDLVIQERYRASLPELIEKYGSEGFIKIENDVLCSLDCTNTVIATGGSAVYGDEAMKKLSRSGKIVYLKTDVSDIADRIDDLHARGIVMRSGTTVYDVFYDRIHLYEKYADVTVDCDDGDISENLARVLAALEQK